MPVSIRVVSGALIPGVLTLAVLSPPAVAQVDSVSPAARVKSGAVALAGDVFTAASTQAVPISVSAVIWPDQQVLDQLKPGDAVPLLPVDVSVTGNRYEVLVDPQAVPPTYLTEGRADIEVTATTGTDSRFPGMSAAAYNESVVSGKSSWRRSPAAVGLRSQLLYGSSASSSVEKLNPARAKRSTEVLSELPGSLVVTSDSAATESVALAPGAVSVEVAESNLVPATNVVADGDAPATLREPICSVNKTSTTADSSAKVADVMPDDDVTGQVTYRVGSSHSLGVGYKSASGSVSEGGTMDRSSSETVAPSFVSFDHTARTTWRYRDYKNSCTQQVTRRPESHQGGYYRPSRSQPSYSHCLSYPSGTVSYDTAKAWTYQGGVTLWGVLNVNAQTGYNTKVTLQYKLATSHQLCGNNANPAQAQLVAAK